MALRPKTIDPVAGLVDYIEELKPYHSKIIEVLVEYVHTDNVLVEIDDSVEFCVNFGFPTLNSIFAFDIKDVDQTANSFIVNGDVRTFIFTGQRIQVAFSSLNDGNYFVNNIIYNNTLDRSTIFVDKTIFSDIADGTIVDSTIEYCPGSNIRSINVLPLPTVICDGGYGNIYDSFTFLVLSVDTIDNEFIIGGDQTEVLAETTTITIVSGDEFTGTPGSEEVATFHIDSTEFAGGNTTVKVVESIDAVPGGLPSGTLHLFAYFIGYDDPLECTIAGNNASTETIFAMFEESLTIDIEVDFEDTIHTYNWENTNQEAYDTRDFAVIESATEPPVPEQATPPPAPSLFDLWFDTTTRSLNQWHNYAWIKIKFAYWFQPDPDNIQNSIYYKLTKNAFADTGWLIIDPCNIDILTCSYDMGGYSQEPYTVFHSPEHVVNDFNLNGFFLLGGDFRPHLIDETTMTGHNEVGKTGDWEADSFNVELIDNATSSLVLHSSAGDMTNVFISGLGFTLQSILVRSRCLTVVSSTFDGIRTTIVVNEVLDDYNLSILNNQDPLGVGNIPGVFYIHVPGTFTAETGTVLPPPPTLPNQAPVIKQIGNWVIAQNEPIIIPIISGDVNGNGITLSTSTLPPGLSLTDFGDGTGEITGAPTVIGTFSNIVVTATDDGSPILDDTEIFEIEVILAGDAQRTKWYYWNRTEDPSFYPRRQNLYFYENEFHALGVGSTVTPSVPNEAPIIRIVGDWEIALNSPIIIPISAIDLEGDTITFSTTVLPPGLSLTDFGDGTGEITGTPTVLGSTDVTLTATDNGTPIEFSEFLFNITVIEAVGSMPVEIEQVATLVLPTTPIDLSTKTISYFWRGPYRIGVDIMLNDGFGGTIIDSDFDISNEIIIVDEDGTTGDSASTNITDELSFLWGDITEWFQYCITFVDLGSNFFLADGNATADIQVGQEIRVLGAVDNAGIYNVVAVFFNGINTEITVAETIPTDTPGGFIEPVDNFGISLFFNDNVGITISENAEAEVLTTSGAMLPNAYDYPIYDVNSYDENLSTVIRLYDN